VIYGFLLGLFVAFLEATNRSAFVVIVLLGTGLGVIGYLLVATIEFAAAAIIRPTNWNSARGIPRGARVAILLAVVSEVAVVGIALGFATGRPALGMATGVGLGFGAAALYLATALIHDRWSARRRRRR
jgi:hypothetical protein